MFMALYKFLICWGNQLKLLYILKYINWLFN